ncbi:MAG: FAD-dependent oxidoreductase [Anaerolineales bacterium]
MSYTIIGNSAAAIGAVEAIRSQDDTGEIVIVSREKYRAYSRPLITYLLAGHVDESRMYYRDDGFYERKGVRTILGREVCELDVLERRLVMDDGSQLNFEKLLIATGGSAVVPQVDGSQLKGVFTLMGWDDARAIQEYLETYSVSRVVVIGGGLIGLKAAEAFDELGLEVTIIELMDLGGVVLKDHRRIECQMVVFGIGVRPNISLVENTPIQTAQGIQVDEHMQTAVEDVYAAGDVVEVRDILLNKVRPIAIWPNAYKQGWVAGCNMAGGCKAYPGSFAMNSIQLFDVPTISVGIMQAEENGLEVLKHFDRKRDAYKKVVLRDGVIVGAILVRDIDRACTSR